MTEEQLAEALAAARRDGAERMRAACVRTVQRSATCITDPTVREILGMAAELLRALPLEAAGEAWCLPETSGEEPKQQPEPCLGCLLHPLRPGKHHAEECPWRKGRVRPADV